MQAQAKSPNNLQYGAKFWIAVWRQCPIKALSSHACFPCKLTHALGPGDIAERFGYHAMVAILQRGLKISGNVTRVFEQSGVVVSGRTGLSTGHVALLEATGHCHGPPYVAILSSFVASGQENDDIAALLFEVHAVSRTVVDAKFTGATSNRSRVASQPERQSIQAYLNAGSRLSIAQAAKPLGKYWRLAQFDHSEERIL